MDKQKKTDIYDSKSERKGLSGFFENLLRKTQDIAHFVLLFPLYAVGSCLLGLSIVPGIYVFNWFRTFFADSADFVQYFWLGSAIAMGYFLYGFTLIATAPLVNLLAGGRVKAWRGPYYSLPAIRWYIHNGITYLVRYSFLEFITPTPMNLFFYQAMGMKIGKGTIINSSHISDPSLITMGKRVTIGGSVSIVGHYGQGGYLVLAPVTIGDNVTVGLRAIIMGGVEIGNNCKILPGSVVLPKTKIPSNETWGGVPAIKIDIADLKEVKRSA